MTLFVDSSVFIAYANSSDVHHENAVKIIRKLKEGSFGDGITTDYIFDEVVSVIMRKVNKKESILFGQHLLNSEILLLPIDSVVFEEAWKLFQKEKLLSFTDSSSVAFMKLYGITVIATFDKAFQEIPDIEIVC